MSDGMAGVMRSVIMATATVGVVMALTVRPLVAAQRGQNGGAPRSPQQAALVDLTGYWVSVVTEDWRFRMLAAPKGDTQGVPLNEEGHKVADNWDPNADKSSGNLCKAYGAAALMRMPERLHITWQDESTLKIEADAGQQVRLLHWGGRAPPQGQEPQWQGYSVATWQREGPRGTLAVRTTQMRAGYLRRNGVPYSDKAVLTEYFDRYAGPNNTQWFTVTAIVSDPTYLQRDFVTTTNFKKEPDESKWNPTPCEMPLMPLPTAEHPQDRPAIAGVPR